jgi:formate hydrogenlyase subunit 3/multisubunit Na+/H+ antiporter MnhD subunit
MTIVIVIALIAVLAALFSAGLYMLRRPREGADPARPPDKRMARALALRVGVSVALFLLILLAWQLGWIAPKGLPTGR